MNMFANLKIGRRLFVSFGILVIFLIGIAWLSIWGIYQVNTAMDSVLTEVTKIQLAHDLDAKTQNVASDVGQMALTSDPAQIAAYQAEIDSLRTAYRQDLDTLKTLATTTQGQTLLAQIEADLLPLKTADDLVIGSVLAGDLEQAGAQFIAGSVPASRLLKQDIEAFLAWRQERLTSTDQATEAQVVNMRNAIIGAALITLLLAVTLGAYLTRSITRPIKESLEFLDTVGKGDISQDPSMKLQKRKDEMGFLALGMLKTTQFLRKNVKEISASAQALSSSATELTAISEQTSAGARESNLKANSVAAAAEEMSANTLSVASGMEQATTSLSSVATAVEEMTSTIGEIARSSEKARYTTEQTSQQITQYAGVMRELGQSANEIGKFTETIASISAQTNLLALNATIEAARAGAAGKGFAVVANEIKELAHQTAAATGEIKNKIKAIQGSAAGAVEDVEKIVRIIQEVNDSVSATAAAIQEQATVTQDIAMNIAQASGGIKDANNRIAQTATVSGSIAREIADVSVTSGQITDASGQTQSSAQGLSELAEQLNQLTAQFKV